MKQAYRAIGPSHYSACSEITAPHNPPNTADSTSCRGRLEIPMPLSLISACYKFIHALWSLCYQANYITAKCLVNQMGREMVPSTPLASFNFISASTASLWRSSAIAKSSAHNLSPTWIKWCEHMVLFMMTNVISTTMKLIEMCGGDATSPWFICIFTKMILIGGCDRDFIKYISASAEPSALKPFFLMNTWKKNTWGDDGSQCKVMY